MCARSAKRGWWFELIRSLLRPFWDLNSEGEERKRTKVPGRRNHLSIRTRSSKGENKNERLALVELTSPSFPFPPLRVPNLVLTDP